MAEDAADFRRECPFRIGPPKKGPFKNGPAKNGPVENGPVKKGPVKNGPVKNGPVKNDLAKKCPLKSLTDESGRGKSHAYDPLLFFLSSDCQLKFDAQTHTRTVALCV